MYCKNCGAKVEDGQAFCASCGQKQYYSDSRSGGVSGNTNTNSTNYGVGVKKVNKIVYALFAILLGSLGIHRFYSGKIVSGIIYILFCWTAIPGILGIIEGILALLKDADANGDIIVDPNSYFL